jgi:hypothetical protein
LAASKGRRRASVNHGAAPFAGGKKDRLAKSHGVTARFPIHCRLSEGTAFMSDIIERVIKAGELPPELRGDLDAETTVLVSVRRLTENGFTEAFEDAVLDAEKATDTVPFRPAHDAIEELAALAKDES